MRIWAASAQELAHTIQFTIMKSGRSMATRRLRVLRMSRCEQEWIVTRATHLSQVYKTLQAGWPCTRGTSHQVQMTILLLSVILSSMAPSTWQTRRLWSVLAPTTRSKKTRQDTSISLSTSSSSVAVSKSKSRKEAWSKWARTWSRPTSKCQSTKRPNRSLRISFKCATCAMSMMAALDRGSMVRLKTGISSRSAKASI